MSCSASRPTRRIRSFMEGGECVAARGGQRLTSGAGVIPPPTASLCSTRMGHREASPPDIRAPLAIYEEALRSLRLTAKLRRLLPLALAMLVD